MAIPSNAFCSSFVFIYDLPPLNRKQLEDQLDQDGKWVRLALLMGYSTDDVEDIRRQSSEAKASPSSFLLTRWGNLNHKITALFVLLSKGTFFSEMETIKMYVESKYHVLIKKDQQSAAQAIKIMNGPPAPTSPPAVAEGTTDNNETPARPVKIPPPLPVAPPPVVVAAAPQIGVGAVGGIAAVASGLPHFSYEDLKAATDNWNAANELGRGGFGVVYKGYFKQTWMAIKKIKGINTESARTELRQSFNELKYLNACRHENVVPLFGCSTDVATEPCLVYQFMPGGSLDNRLFPKSANFTPLSLADRVRIAKGTARGLQYLHTFAQKPIIHGDIKPGNILLDGCNEPKIGDFGLTRELAVSDSSMKVSRVYGTRPYIPKELYSQRQLSTKVDTFSFGLVLYEIVTGMRVYDEKRPIKHLKDYIMQAKSDGLDLRRLIDRSLPLDDNALKIIVALMRVGFRCAADDAEQRLEMVEAYMYLSVL
ncbi:serine/threonine-protein kinase pelle [Uranotaenia lowii]|uniref:serine/threonine-protein kinase pelle n=1 Tax=Uranotaenia lowii TaxID=190385 RepID=UPI002479BEF3|nr:serine/threonine-protein kinase pelle [Uranotaenia lowii]